MDPKKIVLVLSLLGFVMFSGCTFQYGHMQPNSQFAYANSNVKALGPVHAETKKSGWFAPPSLNVDDIKGVYNKALSQVEGANILINFKEDTYFTSYSPLPLYQIKYVLDGEAAKMTVGTQELK
jgi:hypothetical protein